MSCILLESKYLLRVDKLFFIFTNILRQHSDGVKKVDQAIKDVEYYRQVQTIYIIQYISYMKVPVPYGKTHL